jgi:hypothetical protein
LAYIQSVERKKNMTAFARWFLALFGFETREVRYARIYAITRQSAQNRMY